MKFLLQKIEILWKKKKSELQFIEKASALSKRVPLDILVAILVITPFILTPYYFSFSYFTEELSLYHFLLLIMIVSYLCFAILSVTWIINLIKTKKAFTALWEECLIYKLVCLIKDCLLFKSTFFKIIIVIIFTISYGFIMGFSLSTQSHGGTYSLPLSIFATLLYMCLILIYIFIKLRFFNKILVGTSEIVMGNFDSIININGRGALSELANNINNMKGLMLELYCIKP